MARMFVFQDKPFNVGDTITVAYKIKEGDKERVQNFQGILLKIRGEKENKMFVVRKMTRSGVGVERIFPLVSPYIKDIVLDKKSSFKKARAYFIRDLSAKEIRKKLYKTKKKK